MTATELHKTARFILNAEARRDKNGNLTVYQLPEGDGGGTFEVAGINDRYDHDMVYKLAALVTGKRFEEAEEMAEEHYIHDTQGVSTWANTAAVDAFLRDACFNRGFGGAAKILQIALGVAADGVVGVKTRAALDTAEKQDLDGLLTELRHACETYERRVAPPVGARAKFWKGLNNRWDARLKFAQSLV